MTGPEFRAIRHSLGLGVVAWARALGYQGQDNTVSTVIRRYEAPNGRLIPPWIARLADMYRRFGVPDEFVAKGLAKSPKILTLPNPRSGEPIPQWVLSYMQARHRQHVYDIVIQEFIDNKITKAELAKRLNKGADQISRWLGAPGNWTLDTVSDLLFAISGAEPGYTVTHPLDASPV